MPTNGTAAKILWFLLTSLSIVVLSLVSAWALEQRSMTHDLASRVAVLERQFGTIDAKLDMLLTYGEATSRQRNDIQNRLTGSK